MSDAQRMVVVDSESETEAVLKAVFEPRGLRVDRIRNMAGETDPDPPSLLIIDDDELSADIRTTEGWDGVPRVVIGSARFPAEPNANTPAYLQKPFQYPELIHLIDQMLSKRAA